MDPKAIREPAKTENPQEHFAKLRHWVAQIILDKDPVRRSAYQMAMSAIAHRLIKYGTDESLNALTSRDLMALLLYTNGDVAEFLMRVAYFRSIVEGEHDIYEYFNRTLFIPECRAWYWTIAEALIGRAPNAETVTAWIENMTGEEKCVARLIISRVYPDLAHIDWLSDLPDTTKPQNARLGAELCQLLLGKPAYVPLVKNFLRTCPHVRYAVPDVRWPKL